jgi:quinoprotein glucose dehydrogenase
VTAGGLVFFSTGSDRRFRAYDRDTGREVWSMELSAASEGMPATYEIDGRQFIVVPVAAGGGMFAARFGGPGAAGGAGGGRGGSGGGPPGQYIALALKQ